MNEAFTIPAYARCERCEVCDFEIESLRRAIEYRDAIIMLFAAALVVIATLAGLSTAFAADLGCGKDTDRSGAVDNWCPGDDADNDGYTVATGDCSDSDAKIFPGMTTTSGCSAGEYRTCAEAGTGYTSCSAISSSTCSSGSGSTYWIDCDAGSDGTGTFASPYYDFKHVGYFYNSGDRPAGWHDLIAGDCIRVKGTCDTVLQAANPSGYGNQIMALNAKSGTSTDPIRITRWPGASTYLLTSTSAQYLFYGLMTNYVYVTQLKFSGTVGSGLKFSNGGHNKSIGNEFTAINGDCNNNVAAINTGAEDTTIVNNNEIYDLHVGSTGNVGENCDAIVDFESTGVVVSNNSIVQISADDTGYTIKQKRTKNSAGTIDQAATWTARNNIVSTGSISIATAGINSTISNNYIVGDSGHSFCFQAKDLGGTSANKNLTIDNNTCVTANGGFFQSTPTFDYGVNPGNFVITDNVYRSTKATGLTGETGMFVIALYGSDSNYTSLVAGAELHPDRNCYYQSNSQTMEWSVYGDNSGGTKGAKYTSLATWQAADNSANQAKPAYEANSYIEDATLSSAGVATSTNCTGKGWQFSNSGGGSSGAGSFRFRRLWR